MDCSLFNFILFSIGFLCSGVVSNPIELSNKLAVQGYEHNKRFKMENNIIMNGQQSFEEAVLHMDNILADNDNSIPCSTYEASELSFNQEGRRISEAKCLENIWNIKKHENKVRRGKECQKGFPDFTGPRIGGGRPAKPSEFPHMGALGWKAKKGGLWFMCGSILVSEKLLLTAAHCGNVESKNVAHPSPKIVRLGVDNINNQENIDQNPIDIQILKFISHPNYQPEPYKAFDIAVIVLAKKVHYSDFVQPACILNQEMNTAIISGWGVTDSNSISDEKMSDMLQTAEVDIIPRRECNSLLTQKRDKYWNRVLKSQICATKINGIGDICGGDSGGPLQTKLNVNTKKSVYNVIGLSSFGFSTCGKSIFPSVYTNISSFIDWIEEKMEESDNDENPNPKRGRKLDHDNGMTIHKVQTLPEGIVFWLNKNGSHWTYINKDMLEKVNEVK